MKAKTDEFPRNIYWKEAIANDRAIYNQGAFWTQDDAVIFWHGMEASDAQRKLQKRAKCRHCGTIGAHYCPADIARD